MLFELCENDVHRSHVDNDGDWWWWWWWPDIGEGDEDKDVCDKDNDLTLIAPQSPGSVLCGERNSSFWCPGAATTFNGDADCNGHHGDGDNEICLLMAIVTVIVMMVIVIIIKVMVIMDNLFWWPDLQRPSEIIVSGDIDWEEEWQLTLSREKNQQNNRHCREKITPKNNWHCPERMSRWYLFQPGLYTADEFDDDDDDDEEEEEDNDGEDDVKWKTTPTCPSLHSAVPRGSWLLRSPESSSMS